MLSKKFPNYEKPSWPKPAETDVGSVRVSMRRCFSLQKGTRPLQLYLSHPHMVCEGDRVRRL